MLKQNYCSLQSLVVMTFRRRMCTGQSIVLVVLTAHRHILQSILFRWEQRVYQDNLRGVAEDWQSARGWSWSWSWSDHQDGVLVMVIMVIISIWSWTE